ncbi:MAG: hypothetical protein K6E22_13265 [Treponema sp.]|nr:hypothetical protein [Treponema sp.]
MEVNKLFCKRFLVLAALVFSLGFLYAEETEATFAMNLDIYVFKIDEDKADENDDPSGANMNINGNIDISPYVFVGANIGLPFWFWDALSTDDDPYEKNDLTISPSDKIFTFSLYSGLDYNLLDVIRVEAYAECGFISNSWAGGLGTTLSLFLIGAGSDVKLGLKADYGIFYGYSVEVHEWLPFHKLAIGIAGSVR